MNEKGQKVFKYALEISRQTVNKDQIVQMPACAIPVHFAFQDQQPCLWATVPNSDNGLTVRVFRLMATGQNVPDGVDCAYIATAHLDDEVWHLFEMAHEHH